MLLVMQDMIKILDPKYKHDLVFYRNVFTEGMGNDKKCKDLTDEALKAAEVGCRPDLTEMMGKCTDHEATKDVLLFANDGFKLISKDSKFTLTFEATMPYTKTEFDGDKQDKYKVAVARAANTARANVDLGTITEVRRRAGSVKVPTTIRSTDEEALDAMIKSLGVGAVLKDKINQELRAVGLKEATNFTNPLKVADLSAASRSPATWAVTAAASAFALASMV
jgi:hypothetical protein